MCSRLIFSRFILFKLILLGNFFSIFAITTPDSFVFFQCMLNQDTIDLLSSDVIPVYQKDNIVTGSKKPILHPLATVCFICYMHKDNSTGEISLYNEPIYIEPGNIPLYAICRNEIIFFMLENTSNTVTFTNQQDSPFAFDLPTTKYHLMNAAKEFLLGFSALTGATIRYSYEYSKYCIKYCYNLGKYYRPKALSSYTKKNTSTIIIGEKEPQID